MRAALLMGLAVVGVATSYAHAYEFRARWLQRYGNADVVLGGDGATIAPDEPSRRIRVQIGVFDDESGPAPEGGVFGWNMGSISISGAPENSIDRRTPGRVRPFDVPDQPSSNGDPPVPEGGDLDFQMLTDIDATLGAQRLLWFCNFSTGEPLPITPPTIRGRNTYVSVFEFTSLIDPANVAPYSITVSGGLLAATAWNIEGEPIPPDCRDPDDPDDNIPGVVVYEPVVAAPVPFQMTLNVLPTPGVVSVLGIGVLTAGRRRR